MFDVWLSAEHWTGPNLTYSFPTDGSTYNYMNTGDVTPLSASQQTAVRNILSKISSFTGLTFTEVVESGGTMGDLRFATDTATGGAYAYLPSSSESGGDAFFGPVTDNPQIGNESYLYFTHEIGHAMGLNHGHEYSSFVSTGMDSQEFTVVTYTDYVGDTDTFSFDSGVIDWAQSYMQLDISAMQFLYGANYATTGEVWSGNTVYMFDPSTGEMSINATGQGVPAGDRIFRTIWDGDGIDTYDLSNYSEDLIIDLAPGGWSLFSVTQLADLNRNSTDPVYNARGNIANALLVDGDLRALIENAKGGSGDDLILGNQAKNVLKGNGGKDTLKGAAKNDKLFGGNGGDKLFGGNGSDKLFGGFGKDEVNGGKGNDKLKGNGGNDNFVYKNNFDKDKILDFQNNKDTILLNDNLWTGTKSVNKVLNQFGTQDGSDFVLNFGGGDILTIKNTTKNQLLDDIDIV